MTREVAAIVGSGTTPFTRGILSPSQRGSQSGAEGVRTGLQVMVGNPEDLVAVDAFAVSGIAVGTTPLKIFDKNSSPLPRTRMIRVQNATDSSTVTIANRASKIPEGFALVNAGANTPRAYIDLPVLDAVEIWATGSAAATQIRMLLF